ncbi:hypothetical protein BCR33DRAFT_719294 [Rhizoclosmatium globosum]|uniref:Uncharacterized protein n=1 Tax=Rhizoclosmatium globosum TaxID=329046 RepID=A0A1Y2C171_9FUNG|nr:hypothetical protein BCR33DRAFT_719294 [Rhizoclosmatium globosum]|eukprot:ORY40770.1 hypothetical protein BCR33DRAFT_719294 [Rhizoclosmatium globosum]
MLAALTTPKSEQPTEYKLQPLDTVLFAGLDSDPVSKLIKKITLHEVVPELKTPFHEIWTHAGILVDKTVLPIDCLEDGKIYILESGFSGEILGYVYSKILPVDHKVEQDGCHLGPQIRDFAAVVEETDANVGICPLTPEARSLLQQKLTQNPNFVLDIYNKYKSYSYPLTNPLRVVASASTSLHNDLKEYEATTKDVEEKDETVFCSELVSIIYREIGHPTFVAANPDTFSPLELEVAPEFGGRVYYAKEDKTTLLCNNNQCIGVDSRVVKVQRLVQGLKLSNNWVSVGPAGGVPKNAFKIGKDSDGVQIYAARVKIGAAYVLGKIRADKTCPLVTYLEREVEIHFGHEVLCGVEGSRWVGAEEGEIPANAVVGGVGRDGELIYVARAVVKREGGFLGIGARDVWTCGGVAKEWKAIRAPYAEKEVTRDEYEVLCLRS